MPPSWLPPQHLSYRIAQSVQGPSPRFLSGPSLVCTHAVLRPRRLSNKRGCLELGRAIHCFRHFHIIRGVGVPHTSFPPPHMHNLSPPSRTARLFEESQRLVRSPPSKSTLATCRNRTLTRLGWPNQARDSAEQLPSLTTPKAGSCPRRCGYTRRKSSEVRGWHSEFDTSPQVPASPRTAFCIPPILSTLTFDLRLLLFQTLGYLTPRHFRPTARRECLSLKDR